MRIGNLDGRLALFAGVRAFDVHNASGGRWGPDPQDVYDSWDAFTAWARGSDLNRYESTSWDATLLRSPVPRPRQVFAIGLNYDEHTSEVGFVRPVDVPPVFTKFPACISGPFDEVPLPPGGDTDWEVELVAVIGRRAHCVRRVDAWSHVAGLTIGQDLSERRLQMVATPPQFSLAKSYPGFGPLGPTLVTIDEFQDPNDLELWCSINGRDVQRDRSSKMIFSVPELIEHLSSVTPLLPGDVIFTGTPSGVGMGLMPPRYLQDGDELVSGVEGIGELRNSCRAGAT